MKKGDSGERGGDGKVKGALGSEEDLEGSEGRKQGSQPDGARDRKRVGELYRWEAREEGRD